MKCPVPVLLGSVLALWVVCSAICLETTSASPVLGSADEDVVAEPAAPSGQTYIGTTKCSACHFNQFLAWKKDTHSKAFEQLPAKYRDDATCLECHTTGFGKETGFKSAADKHLAGITCESCHGPGSTHAEVCASLPKKDLTAEQEKAARDSIWLMLPQNICVTCHSSKAHKAHVAFDK